nr:hypothetical protein [Tanacetum cinerariifolium]
MQNFHDGLLIPPLGEEKAPEATTDTELSSTEDIQPLPVQEPPQDSNMHQLIDECCEEFLEEQKQNMENTMLDLVKICHYKQFLCMHYNVDDLIESALDSKLLSINSINSQLLDKKEQEVKNVEEQPAERRNRAEKSLQNFRVIHKSSNSLNTSQISSVHAVAPILSTKGPENSLSMGYEHLSITPEMKSDEVIESNAENLLPIPSECEVALEDKRECTVPISKNFPHCDNHSKILFDSNNDDLSSDDEIFEDIEYVDASVPDSAINSVEEENLFCITRLISNIESLKDNSTPDRVLNSFEFDNSLLDNFSLKFETFCDHSEETRSEGDIRFLEELLIDDSILSHESFESIFEDNSSIPRPPPEPPDDNFDLEPEVISTVMEDIDEPDEHFDPGGEIFVSTNNEDVDYFPFMFVIRIFLSYLILPEISPLLFSAESEDTIFDPGISD